MTQKMIAFEFGISINTVGNIAANAYKKLGAHSAAPAVHAHRDAHPWCGSRVDFGPIRERLKASRSTSCRTHDLFLEREGAERSGLARLLSTTSDQRYVESRVK